MTEIQLSIIEANLGTRVWPRTRPEMSTWKRYGYVLYEGKDNKGRDRIKISPEITINSEGRNSRILHEFLINMQAIPVPQITYLREVESQTQIRQVSYLDPTSKGGMKSGEEIKNLRASIFNMIGPIIEETEEYLTIPIAVYEYDDGTSEYKEPHIIPKGSIIRQLYYSTHQGFEWRESI